METDEVSTSTEVTTDDKDSSKNTPETEKSVKLTRNSEGNDDDEPAAKRPRTEESN